MAEESGRLEVLSVFGQNGVKEVGFGVVGGIVDLVLRCETPVKHYLVSFRRVRCGGKLTRVTTDTI